MSKRAITICLNTELNSLLEDVLRHVHTELTACASLKEARLVMARECHSLIILDASAWTAEQALEAVSSMRQDTYAPILIFAPSEATEQLVDAGADECLQADDPPGRIRPITLSLLRRYTLYNHYDERKPDNAVLHRAQLAIDPLRHRVTLSGEEVDLQPREFRLLLHMARNPGIVFTAERIGEIVWPDSCGHNRDVSALISELRRKLGDDWEEPTYIKTVHGVGYRFLPER